MTTCEPRPKQNPNANRHASTKDKEGAAVIPRYNKLLTFAPVTAEVCEPL